MTRHIATQVNPIFLASFPTRHDDVAALANEM